MESPEVGEDQWLREGEVVRHEVFRSQLDADPAPRYYAADYAMRKEGGHEVSRLVPGTLRPATPEEIAQRQCETAAQDRGLSQAA